MLRRDIGLMAILALIAVTGCPAPSSEQVFVRQRESLAIPPQVEAQLETWGAIPKWYVQAKSVHDDWLASLHRTVTMLDWPLDVRATAVGLVDKAANMGATTLMGDARTIVVPISTPVFLRALVEIVNYALVPPDTNDPSATMLLDTAKLPKAANNLALMIGMLSETDYLDSFPEWGNAEVMGTRFIYYHELGHVIYHRDKTPQRPSWILDGEMDLMEELVADQWAFAMLVLELKRYPDLQPYAFAGIAVALGMVAAKEFTEDHGQGKRSIRGAVLRMSRLLEWARRAEQLKYITADSVDLGKFYWEQLRSLLRMVTAVPSPVSQLVASALESRDRWPRARNLLVQWCVFGDCKRVWNAVKQIREQAEIGHQTELLEFVAYLETEYSPIEMHVRFKSTGVK